MRQYEKRFQRRIDAFKQREQTLLDDAVEALVEHDIRSCLYYTTQAHYQQDSAAKLHALEVRLRARYELRKAKRLSGIAKGPLCTWARELYSRAQVLYRDHQYSAALHALTCHLGC